METTMKSVVENCPDLKLLIYASFENPTQKLDISKFSRVQCVSYDEVLQKGGISNIRSNPNELITKDTICVIMYTSGTTGKPKGVLLSHGNIISCSMAMYERINDFENYFNSEGLLLINDLGAKFMKVKIIHHCYENNDNAKKKFR